MRPSPRLRRAARGFTLAELMIVVSIIGVMSAIGIVGYRRHLNTAGTGEAKAMIQMIRASEEAYRAEMLGYLGPSNALDDYYPSALPSDMRHAWIQPGDARYTNVVKGWQLLNITPDGPVRFGYAAVAGYGPPIAAPIGFVNAPVLPPPGVGVPWYVLQAYDRRNPDLPPVILVSSSRNGELYIEGEGN